MDNDYIRYYYNKDYQVLSETDENDTVLRNYIFGRGLDEVLVMTDVVGGDDYYYLRDHLNSPVAMVDEDGEIVERFEYDAYGKPTLYYGDYEGENYELSLCDNPYYFTGRRVDVIDNGAWMIQYNRGRFYDYDTGRWLNQDPIGYQDGVNLYAYVNSNPMNRADSMGLWTDYQEYMLQYLDTMGGFGIEKIFPESSLSEYEKNLIFGEKADCSKDLIPEENPQDINPDFYQHWNYGGYDDPYGDCYLLDSYWEPYGGALDFKTVQDIILRLSQNWSYEAIHDEYDVPINKIKKIECELRKKRKYRWQCSIKPRENCPEQCTNIIFYGWGPDKKTACDIAFHACWKVGCHTPSGRPINCNCGHKKYRDLGG